MKEYSILIFNRCFTILCIALCSVLWLKEKSVIITENVQVFFLPFFYRPFSYMIILLANIPRQNQHSMYDLKLSLCFDAEQKLLGNLSMNVI